MTLSVLAKDDFPNLLVAPWAVRAEAHETITATCQREAVKSRVSRLETALGLPANGLAVSTTYRFTGS